MVVVQVRTQGLAALDDDALAQYNALLDDTETARAARFLRAANRDEFVAAHGLKRLILGEILGVAPKSLRFRTDLPGGKPMLDLPGAPKIRFNLSHTGGLVACAVACGIEVGIDVEAIDRPVDPGLVKHYFAPDEAAWLADFEGAQRDEKFMALWTLKEAVIKALGLGLSVGLDRFSVRPTPPRLHRHDALLAPGQACRLYQWRPLTTHYVALAAILPESETVETVLS